MTMFAVTLGWNLFLYFKLPHQEFFYYISYINGFITSLCYIYNNVCPSFVYLSANEKDWSLANLNSGIILI
jgi:hypothetical protein